ncbi:MAG TPA: DNA alkylation repair protein [Bacteroidetes bacterium]|jgi:3-methyladenine DNA glycosylase AlkD|nr:DNA alkylation repair protein [Bacteroidota bacterium]
MSTVNKILTELKAHANPKNVEGMARYGITAKKAFGVSAPVLYNLAKKIGKDHKLAGGLWKKEILETRVLAAFIEEPERVTPAQMDMWVKDFDSWAVCDGVCLHLFVKTPHAHKKAVRWSKDGREFVKRAGFALMACLAVHDKEASDREFEKYFALIRRAAVDERNFVKKAVNWALRQIGKRNALLNKKAIRVGEKIRRIDSKSARWIAADALRELRSSSVQRRLKK